MPSCIILVFNYLCIMTGEALVQVYRGQEMTRKYKRGIYLILRNKVNKTIHIFGAHKNFR